MRTLSVHNSPSQFKQPVSFEPFSTASSHNHQTRWSSWFVKVKPNSPSSCLGLPVLVRRVLSQSSALGSGAWSCCTSGFSLLGAAPGPDSAAQGAVTCSTKPCVPQTGRTRWKSVLSSNLTGSFFTPDKSLLICQARL